MKQIFRNFLNILKCYKQSSLFNILGLSFAFVACYLIFIQTSYDFGFGKDHKDYQNIYRSSLQMASTRVAAGAPQVKTIIDKSSDVVASALMGAGTLPGATAEINGDRVPLDIEVMKIDSNVNKVFEFDMVVGEYSDIANPNSAIIPLSMADDLYGSAENAIGKKIVWGEDSNNYVVAVYRDFSDLAILPNLIYTHLDVDYSAPFYGFNNYMYFKVIDGANLEQLGDIATKGARAMSNVGDEVEFEVFFSPISEAYFERDMQYVPHVTGNKAVTYTLVFVAILIMIIAIINFVNFAIALAPRRIKAINTYRVLGHSLAGLRCMLVFEAIFISIVSLLLSIVFIQLISDTTFANVFSTSVGLAENIRTLVFMSGFALIVGAIAGVYPAFHITNFSPALVLNGGKTLPKSALLIRQMLISFQYVISISMIIISLFINLQNHFMMNKDYGYDSENILEVLVHNREQVRAELLENYSFIEDITFSAYSIAYGTFNKWGFIDKDVKNQMFDVLPVHYNYPKVMGFEIVEGEDFVEADMKEGRYVLLNETAKERFGIEIGKKMDDNLEVKGFFKDVNHKSLHNAMTPFMLVLGGDGSHMRSVVTNLMSVKYIGDQNIGNVIEAVRKVVAEINEGDVVDISTFDQTRYETYKKDANLNTIISWAAMLAILISVIGVVGLISLESQHRIREIALRKVNGATTMDILKMFNMKFIKIVLVCYMISLPLAWLVVDKWLQGFEYRVPMSAWVFIVAGVFISTLTIFIVTAQSYKAATTNPSQAMQ